MLCQRWRIGTENLKVMDFPEKRFSRNHQLRNCAKVHVTNLKIKLDNNEETFKLAIPPIMQLFKPIHFDCFAHSAIDEKVQSVRLSVVDSFQKQFENNVMTLNITYNRY